MYSFLDLTRCFAEVKEAYTSPCDQAISDPSEETHIVFPKTKCIPNKCQSILNIMYLSFYHLFYNPHMFEPLLLIDLLLSLGKPYI